MNLTKRWLNTGDKVWVGWVRVVVRGVRRQRITCSIIYSSLWSFCAFFMYTDMPYRALYWLELLGGGGAVIFLCIFHVYRYALQGFILTGVIGGGGGGGEEPFSWTVCNNMLSLMWEPNSLTQVRGRGGISVKNMHLIGNIIWTRCYKNLKLYTNNP